MAGERTLASLSNYRKTYQKADRKGRSKLLDEFEEQTGYHRKYAIMLLRCPADEGQKEADVEGAESAVVPRSPGLGEDLGMRRLSMVASFEGPAAAVASMGTPSHAGLDG